MTALTQDDASVKSDAPGQATTSSGHTPPGVFLMIDSLQTGGSERQFAALAQSLDPLAFEVHLGCIQKRGPFLEGLGEISQFSLGGSAYGWHSLVVRRNLARHLRRLNITIAHAFDFYANLTLVPSALMARTPVIIGSQRQLGDLLSPGRSRAQLTMFRLCDAVVCNSRAAADRLLAQGLPEQKVVVIGNGLPRGCFIKAAPALTPRAGFLRVGMIARMNSEAKNHLRFLHAAARIIIQYQDVEFVLVGDGPLRSKLEAEARNLGLANHVRFMGDLRDVNAVLASLDVSVQPSVSESLSNVIIESMAAGVPVVASRVGGNAELINEDRGILIAPRDDQSLADAILLLLRDSSLREGLGRNAQKFAQANFTVGQMQQRHQSLYTELLDRKVWRQSRRVVPGLTEDIRPIRISIVAASSRYVGGHSVQAKLLLEHWRNDPEVEAVLITIDPLFPRGFQWAENIPFLRTIIRMPLYWRALWRGLKNAAVVHIFSASYWSFIVAPVPAWIIARVLKKKTLIHYHSGEARDHLRRFRTASFVLKRTDALIVPSGYLVDVFHEFGVTAKAIPNIVDRSQFSFRLRNPLRPHLVCTRGFHPYYCVDVVVRAFAEVRKTFPDARLDLVGGGPSGHEIRSLVGNLGIGGITFSGVANRDEIPAFYDRADIFINASRLDNMPVSILEAFSAGTPVVSTAPEGMRYLVDHGRTGLLSEVGDHIALAANVIRLLENPELTSKMALAAHRETESYSWEAVRPQWLDVYRSLTDKSKG